MNLDVGLAQNCEWDRIAGVFTLNVGVAASVSEGDAPSATSLSPSPVSHTGKGLAAESSWQALQGEFGISFRELDERPSSVLLDTFGLDFPDQVVLTADSATALTNQTFRVPGGSGKVLGVRAAGDDLQIALSISNGSAPLEIEVPAAASVASDSVPQSESVPAAGLKSGPNWGSVLEFTGAGAVATDHGISLTLTGWKAQFSGEQVVVETKNC